MRWQTLFEARWILAVLGVFTLAGAMVSRWLALPFGLLIGFTLWFFRDPDRECDSDADTLVAPADGKVVEIAEVEEAEVLGGPALRIGIFLSVFDVHTNRAPTDGEVTYCQHHPGKFLDARNPESSSKNERMTWAFKCGETILVVRQITGAVARRIVPWSKVGDYLQKGERFGMIRFGSRTEIYLPLGTEVLVKKGDKVRGGATVVARLRSS